MNKRSSCESVSKEYGIELDCCEECHESKNGSGHDLYTVDLPDGRKAYVCCRIAPKLMEKLLKR